MIIRYLDIIGIAVLRVPYEADSKLIIDSNTMLTFSIFSEFFQVVVRRNSQIFQPDRRVECDQFPFGYVSQIRRGSPLALPRIPKLLRIAVCETLDHNTSLTHDVNNVNL
jgi:hypothetical protein